MTFQYSKLFQAMAFTAVITGGLLQGQAMAAGTTAGTDINNKATLSFSVGGTPQTVIESKPLGNTTPGVGLGEATTFKVDRRINLVVATTNTAPVSVALGNNGMITSFTVTNSTNDVIDVILSNIATMAVASTGATGVDNADLINGNCTMHADAAGATSAITRLPSVAADAVVPVYVKCNIQPLSALPTPQTYVEWNNRVSVVSLVGQAAIKAGGAAYTQDTGPDDAATVQNVFGDEAGGNAGVAGALGTTLGGAGNAVDAYRDGIHSANSAYKIIMPILTVTKVETLVCDPLNGASNPKRIPGALVRYSITVSNAAVALASGNLTTVTDPLQTDLIHDVNFVAGTSAASCIAGTAATSGGVAGSGFRLSNVAVTPATAIRPAGPVYLTNALDTDGAGIAAQDITINYTNGLPVVGTTHTAGEIKPGESVTVEFQAFIK
jgi:hypothetical protein